MLLTVEYIVDYIVESKRRRERRERTEGNIGLRCIKYDLLIINT
jgi:hypothetical protein